MNRLMIPNSLVLLITILIAHVVISANLTWASQYSYTTILPPGWSWSYVHAINDDGNLVGYGEAGSVTKSFLYRNGAFTDLLPPGWSSAYALTINSHGEIVGYGTVNGTDKAFLYIGESFAEVLPPGWSWAWGIRLNDNAEVVGGGFNGTAFRGFLYSNGSYTELMPPGWTVSTAYGINNYGVIVGWGTDGSNFNKGYIYDNGLYTELLPPGWLSATAYNINNAGEVIGEGIDSDGREIGYIYKSGEYIELLPPGWSDVVPEDIDDSGTVAGYGIDGGIVKGFVYYNGSYLILTSNDRPNTEIIGINNNREVVGVTFNSARGFVSTLCSYLPVRILKILPEYYSSLHEAYERAVDDDIIQLHDIIFAGGVLFDLDKSVTVTGGYDCEYTSATGTSIIDGNIVITGGTVRIENVVLE